MRWNCREDKKMNHFPAGTLLTLCPLTPSETWRSSIENDGHTGPIHFHEVMIALGERQALHRKGFRWSMSYERVHHPKWGPGWVYWEVLERVQKKKRKVSEPPVHLP